MIFDFNDGWTLTKENGESFSVCLPHDAMLGEKRYASCRNAVQGGYFPGGKYRYTKHFKSTKVISAKHPAALRRRIPQCSCERKRRSR